MEAEMKLREENLKLLMKLFNAGKMKLETDKDGFVFRCSGGTYPVEIYEDGHWDGSLTQSLCHMEREEKA